jgi:hypothetical protein
MIKSGLQVIRYIGWIILTGGEERWLLMRKGSDEKGRRKKKKKGLKGKKKVGLWTTGAPLKKEVRL